MRNFEEKESLLKKPLWQMTGEEFLMLHRNAEEEKEENAGQKKYAYGIQQLSDYIGCCQSTVYELKKKGVLDEAIVSHVGRKIVFDAEKARVLASEYQSDQRHKKRVL